MAKGRLKGKLKNAVKKATAKAKDKLKNAGDVAGLAPLLPFKPLMVRMLKRKGEKVTMATKMSVLVPLFNERIVKKATKVNYEDLETLEYIDPALLLGLVPVVLGFIQGIIKKREEGKKLDEEEEEVFKGAKEAQETVKEEAKDESGNWFADNKMIIIGAAAVILFLVLRKK